jgi:hypothetical protein
MPLAQLTDLNVEIDFRPYWNLMDFTPEGRPDRDLAPRNFRSEFLEAHDLNDR